MHQGTTFSATISALGVEHATIVGNSFGGLVAQRVAVFAPDFITSLMLISSPASGIDATPELEAAWEAEERPLQRGDIDAAVQAVVDAWTLPGAPQELRDRLAAMQRRAFELRVDRGEVPEGPDPLENDLQALLRVDAPAWVLVGEHDKPDFHTAADALAQFLPNARRTVVAGAGHLAPLEQPEAFRKLLLSFMG